jgi:hypothetical protein
MNTSVETYRLVRFVNDFGDATSGSFPKNYSISLNAGQVARVATAWTSRSSGGAGPDQLGADIDLCVYRSDTNAVVGCSASVQNAWELVEFTAPVTGNYRVEVRRFSAVAGWPGSYLGTAWSVRSLPDPCNTATVVPSTGGTFSNVSTSAGGTFFDSYPSWGLDQSGRERVLRLTLPTTKDITFTDTNPNLDLHVVQFSSCTGTSAAISSSRSGADSVFVDNAPAGVYYLIVDGRSGAVGATNLGVSVAGP